MSDYYHSQPFTPIAGFPDGIEGPACDRHGNLYAVNFSRLGTIGKVTPEGESSLFVTLPTGSTGNGIRFTRLGQMLIADYTGHNILIVDMESREINVYAHNPGLYQPNDIAISANDIVFASDPSWENSCGRIFRIGSDGKFVLLEDGMGTTNGIEISPDERRLYVNESIQKRIWVYDLSQEGHISNKRLFYQFQDFGLDGMRCDVNGNLFVTRYGKGTVAMLNPSGQILREIQLHGKTCTNLTFGGPDGRTVYVTVADNGNIEKFQAEFAGRLTSFTSC